MTVAFDGPTPAQIKLALQGTSGCSIAIICACTSIKSGEDTRSLVPRNLRHETGRIKDARWDVKQMKHREQVQLTLFNAVGSRQLLFSWQRGTCRRWSLVFLFLFFSFASFLVIVYSRECNFSPGSSSNGNCLHLVPVRWPFASSAVTVDKRRGGLVSKPVRVTIYQCTCTARASSASSLACQVVPYLRFHG